jgi:HEAT repeat protein
VTDVRAFLRRWDEATPRGRKALAAELPVAAVQSAALADPSPAVRQACLGLLDHYASDASTATFAAALADPIPAVREIALHGISCERCGSGICVADVVPAVSRLLAGDPSAETRYKALRVMAQLADRSPEAAAAVERAATADADPAVRAGAAIVLAGGHLPNHQRVRRRVGSARAKRESRAPA